MSSSTIDIITQIERVVVNRHSITITHRTTSTGSAGSAHRLIRQQRCFCVPTSYKCQLPLVIIVLLFIQSTWNVSLSFSWITTSSKTTTSRRNTCFLNINSKNHIVKTVHKSNNNNNNNNFNNDMDNNKIIVYNVQQQDDEIQSISRNNFFKKCQQILTTTTTVIISSFSIQQPTVVYGACLQGDTSDDCIGVYKVPLDDEIIDYINTEEKLIKYAPGIRYVEPIQYPKSIISAIQQIQQIQNEQITTLQSLLLKGDLLNLGKIILYISPRITLAGRVIIQSLENDLKKLQLAQSTNNNKSNIKKKKDTPIITIDDLLYSIYRIQITHSELVSSLGECDITIGQGMRGELGSITATQLVLLQEITEIISNYDTFLKSIPNNYITIATSSTTGSKKR